MDIISSQDWALIHLGLIFLITCANLLVAYVLSSSSTPTPGLGLYTVYFMAALLGWIAYTLQQLADVPMTVDVPSVAGILSSFLLYLAAGERAGTRAGRTILGLFCLCACFSVFFLPAEGMFLVRNGSAGLMFTCIAILASRRALQKGNTGDAVIAFAALLITFGVPLALYQLLVADNPGAAQAIAFGANNVAYILIAIGFLASVTIEYQQHLAQLATRDPLTQLLNRRGLESALQVPLAQAGRQQQTIAAIMVDIDQLREINENFGHDVGDHVLGRIASVLRQMSRSSDVVARTGGAEFLLVLPETQLDDAKVLAERILSLITERPLLVDSHRIPVTVSMGVAAVLGNEGLDKLSQEADRAMLLAKRSGHNRVASVERKPIHLSSQASHG